MGLKFPRIGSDCEMQTMQQANSEPARPRQVEFVVGHWRVQPQRNRIHHRRRKVERKLEPRLMRLLGFLAANSDRTLRRDELIAELWPRVIVTENSLTRAVSELRKHLASGDDSVQIETVPKYGYRLVTVSAAGETDGVYANPKRFAPQWTALALSVLAAVFVAGGWIMVREPQSTGPFRYDAAAEDFERRFVPVGSVGFAGVRSEAPVLSADGSRFAFIQHDATGSTIWLGELEESTVGGEPVAVYHSSMTLENLVWSPAGNALLFARRGPTTTEALHGGSGSGQLLQLDLTTWTVSRLERKPEPIGPISPPEIDLT